MILYSLLSYSRLKYQKAYREILQSKKYMNFWWISSTIWSLISILVCNIDFLIKFCLFSLDEKFSISSWFHCSICFIFLCILLIILGLYFLDLGDKPNSWVFFSNFPIKKILFEHSPVVRILLVLNTRLFLVFGTDFINFLKKAKHSLIILVSATDETLIKELTIF